MPPVMMRKSLLYFLLFAALTLPSCRKDDPAGSDPVSDPEAEEETIQPGEYRLPLIETTDIHGHVVEIDNSGNAHYRMAYIADKVLDVRGRDESYQKDRLLLLDGGDLYQGASISNLTAGWPVYVSVDRMDYDAVTVGNHEFDWGIENTVDSDATMPDYDWKGQRYENKVPVVCANLYQNGSRVPFTKDYIIVEKNAVNSDGATVTVKIGIIGFADNYAKKKSGRRAWQHTRTNAAASSSGAKKTA